MKLTKCALTKIGNQIRPTSKKTYGITATESLLTEISSRPHLKYKQTYVQFHFLKTASTNAQHKLLTMAPKTQGKRLVKQKLTEMKQVTNCLLSWCNRTGQGYDSTQEQYSIFPRAIADEKGCRSEGNMERKNWKEIPTI